MSAPSQLRGDPPSTHAAPFALATGLPSSRSDLFTPKVGHKLWKIDFTDLRVPLARKFDRPATYYQVTWVLRRSLPAAARGDGTAWRPRLEFSTGKPPLVAKSLPHRSSPSRLPAAATIAESIRRLLLERGPTKSICPSEVARELRPADFRPLMPAVRAVAAELARQREIVVTQRGVIVDPTNVRGPIRYRMR